ncbi:serine hydrolase domain-containing protein [Chitinophaga filiformis]|uniref:CubicO group peptidase, beta-lactamase class C family n=1 Tax=Chitinophaga filiformis TaxID=104663 RepID=A0A1G7SEZ9_CHIFI|nr:serine hydrolase domain-containing protein [Chitinophaga filiformis]SDG21573.1 CubicO group peptidase, beta-lactamase class C family [Chitinophaga filiformis]
MRPFILFLTCFLLPVASIAQQDTIDVFIASQMKQQGIVGLSIGIIKSGKVIKAKGYGRANIELDVPASEKTVYKIGSISKQFVAVGIMELVQEGKLKVSDPITKFIKNVPAKWNAVTIRHLLNHTSGLPIDPPGFDGMRAQADSVYIKTAFTDSLDFPTGSKFEYSNFGYFILADIIRIASGQSFPDFMKKCIFDECGMGSTRTTSLEAIVPNRAAGYIKDANDSILNAPNYIALRPSGAFLSNINDLLKWEMEMQNGKLLTQKNWNLMWGDTIKTPLTMDNEVMYYGYGWMTNKLNGKQFVHHAGSLPGFKSVYFRYIEDKTAIIMLTNADNADVYAIAFGVADLLQTGK